MMNNENPNSMQQRADSFFNGQIPAQNFHALGSLVPYIDSREHSMFGHAGDFGNMDPRYANPMGNYVSGGSIGNQLNAAAGLRASGHLPYHHSVRSGGPGDINVQGTNIPMEAMLAQGLLQRPHSGMYLHNQKFSMQLQNGDVPALTGFRGSTMDYPVQTHPNENLHDYALHQLQSPHLSAGLPAGFKVSNPLYMPHHQQQLNPAISGGGISIRQPNIDSHLRPHVTDLIQSRPVSYHSNSMVQAHNMELGAAGTRPLNHMGSYGGQYDEILRQHEPLKQTQLQMQQLQSADAFIEEDRKPKSRMQRPIDPYGLVGLLHVVKKSQPNSVSAHGLGIDLTTLGLNLTQPDDLHKGFLSPFSEKSVKDVLDCQFMVPACYNNKPAADLQPYCFLHFRLPTLFYIFYSMPKDVAQLYAAHELMRREWLYHKELRIWLIRNKKKGLLAKTDTYERGAIIYFDHNQWKVIEQENFVLKYELIEERPNLPNEPEKN